MKYFLFAILLFGGMFAFGQQAHAQSATLYFTPDSGTYAPGETFRVTIMVDTQVQAVNAVAAYFSYPADTLDVAAVDTTESAITSFGEDQVAAGLGTISGTTEDPGFTGVQKIAVVDFLVKPEATGSIELAFRNDAAVLRNSDSQNILSLPNSGNATFEIGEATTTVPPEPEPEPEQDSLQIFGVQAERLGPHSIQISWQTNKPANAQVDYGVGANYEFSVLAAGISQNHTVLVSQLQDGQAYQFQVKSATTEGEVVLLENLSLEDLLQEQDTLPTGEGETFQPQVPDQLQVTGFEFTPTSIILFIGLPLLVLLIIVFLVIRRIRRKRLGY